MRSEDELERDPRRGRGDLDGIEAREGVCERLARDVLLVLVLAAAAQPVVLLREVRQSAKARSTFA
jgi:hypothetical protein